MVFGTGSVQCKSLENIITIYMKNNEFMYYNH